jgi:hypothetical protein
VERERLLLLGFENSLYETEKVFWTRNPFAWLQSNYEYDLRGDEDDNFGAYINKLQQPEIIQKLNSIWGGEGSKPGAQSFPRPNPSESYKNYLRRISEDEGLFMTLFRTSGDYFGLSLTKLVQLGARGGHNFPVCLDDFMASHSSFMATWQKIRDLVGDHSNDPELDACLSRADPSLNTIRHATNHDSETTSRILRSVRRLDAKYFDGEFARAEREIG